MPFGKSKIIQEGSDLTIITWGAMVQLTIEAVNDLNLNENAVEIIDLRTLNPLDFSSILLVLIGYLLEEYLVF